MEISNAQINELRQAFLQQLSTKGNDAVHANDLAKVNNDDFWLKRFLMHHDGNQQLALEMMWETVTWRKDFGANDINSLVKKDIIAAGGFFPNGRDKDGCSIFIFKCKLYVKSAQPIEDLKRCVVYWFEKLEKIDKGQQITLFFDMENCGIANMDLEFTKYLIGLFKQYYPYFLNYILIFEMPWILNAAFRIIKSWLPEKAVQKIKFVSKKDIKEFVPLDQALTCWGGNNTYTFSYIPEDEEPITPQTSPGTTSNRKVHFAEGSMSDSPDGSADKDHNDGNALSVQPSAIINFVKEGDELVSTLDLQNTDASALISFKLKTTSPEKFRVRPSVGVLTPGSRTKIKVNLLPGFQLGGLSRDKFLVMSTIIAASEQDDLNHIWKDTSGRKISQHRLKCAQGDFTKNGNAITISGSPDGEIHNLSNITSSLNKSLEHQTEIHVSIKRLQSYQMITIILVLIMGVVLGYLLRLQLRNDDDNSGFCHTQTP